MRCRPTRFIGGENRDDRACGSREMALCCCAKGAIGKHGHVAADRDFWKRPYPLTNATALANASAA
jgi:hypothetical protein